MVDYLWQLLDVDGSGFLPPRATEDVFEAVREGDVPVGSGFHRHCAAHLFFHRGGDLYPDEVEYPESLDAPLGVGLYHPRDYVAGVLFQYHVLDFSG